MTNSAQRRGKRFKEIAVNLLTLSISVLVGYVLLGGVMLVYGPAILWKPFNQFPTAISIPWQASGPGDSDEAYIAILGDSYAAGFGDWNAERQSRTDPYYSGDVIANQLSRPVLSFGRGGAGSVRGLVTNPGRIMHADSCALLRRPPPPNFLIVYFYEGNDLNNNFKRLGVVPGQQISAQQINDYIVREANSAKSVPCYTYVNYILYNLMGGQIKRLVTSPTLGAATTSQSIVVDGRVASIPEGLQGPALELDSNSLATSLNVLDQSLKHLLASFPDTRVLMVDVPSVLTSYSFVNDSVSSQTYHQGESRQPASKIARQSDYICNELRTLSLQRGIGFFDARPALRKMAMKQKIHGPLDWKHLNRTGQTVLGQAVAQTIKDNLTDSGCAKLVSFN